WPSVAVSMFRRGNSKRRKPASQRQSTRQRQRDFQNLVKGLGMQRRTRGFVRRASSLDLPEQLRSGVELASSAIDLALHVAREGNELVGGQRTQLGVSARGARLRAA